MSGVRYFTDGDLRQKIRALMMRKRGEGRRLAIRMGVSPTQLSGMVCGKLPVSEKVAKYLGYEVVIQRQRLYRKVKAS